MTNLMFNYPIEKHIDGEWHTSRHTYKDYNLMIKMRPHSGCKIHITKQSETKPVKTFRFNFAQESQLLKKAHQYIDNL